MSAPLRTRSAPAGVPGCPRAAAHPLLHPARTMPFDVLAAGLEAAHARQHVYRRPGPDALMLYVYTERCVYDDGWDPFTLLARGLILDLAAHAVVATPFPKFFNLGERAQTIPDLPFEAFEKLDGSLIIAYHHRGRWQAATKGAFASRQAVWATAHLHAAAQAGALDAWQPGATYLLEYVGPENRVVVPYAESALRFLGGYDAAGAELRYEAVNALARATGWPVAARHAFPSLEALVAHARTLPRDQEGYVLRFADGLRLKVKGDEYKRLHALIARVTPLALWDALAAGDDLDAMRRDIPEEFWGDFDQIRARLSERLAALDRAIRTAVTALAQLSDKEVGLRLASVAAEVRPFVFSYRKAGVGHPDGPSAERALDARTRRALLRAIRPTANALPGYTPSFAMGRVLSDDA